MSAFAGLRDDAGPKSTAIPWSLLLLPVLVDTFLLSGRVRLPHPVRVRPLASSGWPDWRSLCCSLWFPLKLKSFTYTRF